MKMAQLTANSYNVYRNSYLAKDHSKPKPEELPISLCYKSVMPQATPTFMSERKKINPTEELETSETSLSSLVRLLKDEVEELNCFTEFMMSQLVEKDRKFLETERQFTELKHEHGYLLNAMENNVNIHY